LARTFRMLWRLVTLAWLYSPLFLGVPLALTLGRLFPSIDDALWAYALRAVHAAGPAYIKLAQWASSRNDLFPVKFCRTFEQLHDNCFPHAWHLTERILVKEIGAGWQQTLHLQPEVIGSGCIAQVYRGRVRSPSTGKDVDVAVKVIHPSVEALVVVDIDIMRTLAQALSLFPALKWLSLPDVVEDFALQMFWQLDLRQEALNLQRLHRNFKDDDAIVIPAPILELSSRDLLVETFQPGVPISSFILSDRCDAVARKELSRLGMNSMAKMIFIDNFVHCDLHPGNILV
ncbi:ABC1 family-domain-containing protein, partial [Pavlovales sp. CCMP2436]